MSRRPIYLDHHATTPLDERVLARMLPYFQGGFGNPSSVHGFGSEARKAVDRAREEVAALLGAQLSEIVFTSGATESDNLAIKGVAHALRDRGRHLVTTAIEHPGVLESCRRLEREGWRVTFVGVDRDGRVDPESVRRALEPDTVLVSAMLVNNEVGTVLDVGAIGALTREKGVLLHCDATQGVGRVPCDVHALGVDLLSLSAHKICGPKGVGALYVRKRGANAPRVQAEIDGGGQEGGARSGTLNVPGIVGLGAACEILRAEADAENRRLRALRNRLRERLVHELSEVVLNGSEDPARHPGNLHLSFRCVDAATLLMRLEDEVACSMGSACASGELASASAAAMSAAAMSGSATSGSATSDRSTARPPSTRTPSYVLTAMGRSAEEARSAVRFGIGRTTTAEEIEAAADSIVRAVNELRERSDAWSLLQKGVDPEAIEW